MGHVPHRTVLPIGFLGVASLLEQFSKALATLASRGVTYMNFVLPAGTIHRAKWMHLDAD
jgi:hypothetical protein